MLGNGESMSHTLSIRDQEKKDGFNTMASKTSRVVEKEPIGPTQRNCSGRLGKANAVNISSIDKSVEAAGSPLLCTHHVMTEEVAIYMPDRVVNSIDGANKERGP